MQWTRRFLKFFLANPSLSQKAWWFVEISCKTFWTDCIAAATTANLANLVANNLWNLPN